MPNNSKTSQQQRLLTWLKDRSITTTQAREQLDILGVAPRIYELRHEFDHNITTEWSTYTSGSGNKHKVARYVLQSGSFKENNKKASSEMDIGIEASKTNIPTKLARKFYHA